MRIPNIKNGLKTLGLATLVTLAHCDMPKKTMSKTMSKDCIEFATKAPAIKLPAENLLSKVLDLNAIIFGKYIDTTDISSAKNLIKDFEGSEQFAMKSKGKKYYQVYYGKADEMADKANRKRGMDVKNLLTVGHGHSQREFIELSGGKKLKIGNLITSNQADSLLDVDLKGKQDTLQMCLRRKISNNEKDAILSYMFNVDWKTLVKSDSTRKISQSFFECLNQGEKGKVQSKFNIIDAGGIVQPGLIQRRLTEMIIFGNGEIYKDTLAQENFATLLKKLPKQSSENYINNISKTLKNYGIDEKKITNLRKEMTTILHPQN